MTEFKIVTPITKSKFDEIMNGIIDTANKIEADRGGERLTYDEGYEIAKQAIETNVGLREFIINFHGSTKPIEWLTAQF